MILPAVRERLDAVLRHPSVEGALGAPRDGAQHTDLIGSPGAPAGKYDTRFVRCARHAEVLLGAQGTIENHQHRGGCAPDVSLMKRNRKVVATDLSQHSEMPLLVRWVKQKR